MDEILKFEDLNLIKPLLRAAVDAGYNEPTPIQIKAIPLLLEGRDLIGCAKTGTGKTAAFALPILQLLECGFDRQQVQAPANQQVQEPANLRDQEPADQRVQETARQLIKQPEQVSPIGIKALILTPTRELAIQIDDSFTLYGKYLGISHTAIFGGVSQDNQVRLLTNGVDILTATPGRLLDLVWQKHIDFGHLKILVLDEADRMLDMGFAPDVSKIIELLPVRRQSLLFSATMPKEIEILANNILTDPVRVEADPSASTVDEVRQFVCYVPRQYKTKMLTDILKTTEIETALVFTRTKSGADRIYESLIKSGIKADVIHGGKTQGSREHALNSFKSRRTRILVATDVAARGLDIAELSHVINYDVPTEPDSYVHRVGRTARAGLTGIAVTLCGNDERHYIKDIQNLISKKLTVIADQKELSSITAAASPATTIPATAAAAKTTATATSASKIAAKAKGTFSKAAPIARPAIPVNAKSTTVQLKPEEKRAGTFHRFYTGKAAEKVTVKDVTGISVKSGNRISGKGTGTAAEKAAGSVKENPDITAIEKLFISIKSVLKKIF